MDWAQGKRETSASPRRIDLGALALDCLTLEEAVGRLQAAVRRAAPPLQVVTANAQFLGMARRDPAYAQVLRDAGMVVPDGVPLLWLCRLQEGVRSPRITGHDLVQESARLAAERGLSVAFLGAAPGVAQLAGERLQREHPGLRVAGYFQGTFNSDGTGVTREDEEGTTEAIREAQPDFLFVALGCPKQEMWIHRHQHEVGVPVAIGVGGVLDVLAGRFKRAPRWAQRAGVEWLYRLAQDPKRLGKRYLTQDVPTLTLAGWAALRKRMAGSAVSR